MSDPGALYDAAKTFVAQKQYPQAQQLLQRIPDDSAVGSDARVYRGMIALAAHQSEEAKLHFLKAIELDPLSTAAHANLADVYFREKDFDRARAQYEQVRSIDPKHPGAQERLAKLDDLEHSKDTYQGDTYDLLRGWTDSASVAAVRMIDDNKLRIDGLRLAAYSFPRFLWVAALIVLFLSGADMIYRGHDQISSAKEAYQMTLTSSQTPIEAQSATAVMGQSDQQVVGTNNGDGPAHKVVPNLGAALGHRPLRRDPASPVAAPESGSGTQGQQTQATTPTAADTLAIQATYRAESDAGSENMIIGIGIMLVGLGVLAAFLYWLAIIKRTVVIIDRGYITVETGVFTRTRKMIEIQKIPEFIVHQYLLNQRDNEGSLILYNGPKEKRTEFRGLAPYDELVRLATNLRSLRGQLRTTPLDRGVYS